MSDDDNYRIGYGRPPKHRQWKKGQSGCPTGGHEQRKKKAQKKAQDEMERRERSIRDIIKRIATESVTARTKDGEIEMTRLEALLRSVFDAPHKPNARANAAKDALALVKSSGLLDPTPKDRPMVLVVPAMMEEDEWAKATEGEKMSKNPLEGIPGAEEIINRQYPTRKKLLDEENET